MTKDTPKKTILQGNPLLAAALEYAGRGWHVFPAYEFFHGACACPHGVACDHPGNHPRFHPDDLRHGHNSATTDPELLTRWWQRWPNANVAIATGRKSNLLIMVLDPSRGGDIDKLPGEVPPTVVVRTGGGGLHYYFKYPEGQEVGCVENLLPGVDVRAEGGFILAPPSIAPLAQDRRLGGLVWQ